MCDDRRSRDYHHSYPHHHDYRGWDHGPDRGPPPDRCRCDCDCNDEDEELQDEDDPTDFGFERRFVSNAEMLLAYEGYLEELLNEAQGVREAIAELKAEMRQIDADEEELLSVEDEPKKSGARRKADAKKAKSQP